MHPGRLNYYKDGESSDRLGSILLPGATLAVFASDVFQSHPFCVGITPQDGNERQYVLDCDSVAHRASWMAALQVHVKQRIRTSPGVSVREGFLTKQGGTFKSWKKRYMILSKTHLKYYPSFTDLHDCLGTIPLGGGFVVGSGDDDAGAGAAAPSTPSSSSSSSSSSSAASASSPVTSAPPSSPGGNTMTLANNPYGFSLRSHGNSRTFYFVTNSRSDRDGWVHALQEIQKIVQI